MILPSIRDNDWVGVRKNFQKLASIKLGDRAHVTFADLTLTNLTASRLLSTDADKKLTSISNLTTWIAGVVNETDVADDGDGTITIGLVNPLIVGKGGTGVATLTDHGILLGSGTDAITPLGAATNGQIPIGSTGADPILAAITGTTNQITVTNAAGSITLSTPQNIHTGASPTFADLTLSAPVNIYALSHDSFADFVVAEHLSLPNTIANVLSDHNLAAHTSLGLFDASSDVDHDQTTNVHQNVNTSALPSFAGLTVTKTAWNVATFDRTTADAQGGIVVTGRTAGSVTAGGAILGGVVNSTTSGLILFGTHTATNEDLKIDANGLVFIRQVLFINTIKSGATQAAAGAAANELWKTASHATLPDNVVMIGV